jgi:hypothetical protein
VFVSATEVLHKSLDMQKEIKSNGWKENTNRKTEKQTKKENTNRKTEKQTKKETRLLPNRIL